MRLASFFSGIGGLELGLEAALGAETVFQCEYDPWCLAVLERHWPNVTRCSDVVSLRSESIPDVDIWCGGFPCQDLSGASAGRDMGGLEGARSGLWWELSDVLLPTASGDGSRLNPEWRDWFMGFPPGWTSGAPESA